MDAVQKFMQMLKGSAIMRQQVYQLLFAALTLIGAKVDLPFIQEHGEAIVDGILTTLSALVAVWTMFTRATKPSPNLTEMADRKEAKLVSEGVISVADATHSVAVQAEALKTAQGGFARISLMFAMGMIVLAVLAIIAGCVTTNPIAAAQTTEQKIYASYGTLTIFSERGASIIQDPTYPDQVKVPIAQAIRAVKPAADKTSDALVKLSEMKAEVAAGENTEEQLKIATENLSEYYKELVPLVNDVVLSVTVGLRCYRKEGADYNACVQAVGGAQ